MTKYDENELIQAVRRHAIENYNSGGWDYLVECWDDGDILEQISEAKAQTPAACIKQIGGILKIFDDHRREIRNA